MLGIMGIYVEIEFVGPLTCVIAEFICIIVYHSPYFFYHTSPHYPLFLVSVCRVWPILRVLFLRLDLHFANNFATDPHFAFSPVATTAVQTTTAPTVTSACKIIWLVTTARLPTPPVQELRPDQVSVNSECYKHNKIKVLILETF